MSIGRSDSKGRSGDRYPNVRGIRTFTIEMEPGSPWHLDPELFGVKTDLSRILWIFIITIPGDKSPFSSLGYWIPDFFRRREG